jgi:transposase
LRFPNVKKGHKQLLSALKPFDVRIVVMEATGKYHRAIHGFLHDAGLAAAVVNPLRARLFAESIGVLAKTDSVDARMLAATPPLRGACCHSLLGMRLRPESPSSPAP